MTRLPPLAALALALQACQSTTTDDGWGNQHVSIDTDDDADDDWFFDPDHVIEVDIDIAPDDWDALRHQSRNLLEMVSGDCLAEPFESPYTWFQATVTIDEHTLESVGIRKKGLIGSDSDTRPSLKLDFDRIDDDQDYRGLSRMTLNNGRQDPSRIHQCLGYDRLRAAGLAASRCNYAVVTVNGEYMGVYSNVEPVKKPFLRRHFGDDSGNLYEGTLSDFREGWVSTFAKKTHEDDPDRDDLDAVVQALDGADEHSLESRLDAVIDLDAYLDFWAMEVMLGHWDGYAGNTNNFYVYRDPADGRFDFIPWGIDALFEGDSPFGASAPTSVVANAALPAALYGTPGTQARYVEHLTGLLDDVWDESALLDEVDRMEDLLSDRVLDDVYNDFVDATEGVRDFVEHRREGILSELDQGPPIWGYDLRAYPCLVEVGSVDGVFETTYGTLEENWWTTGSATVSFNLWGADYPTDATSAAAGDYEEGALILVTGDIGSGTALIPYFTLPLEDMVPGVTYEVDWWDVDGYLGYTAPDVEWATAAYLYQGTLTLDEAGTGWGDTVSGSFSVAAWGG